eukprot:3457576-Pyramimonas_sp.AAC.1
MPWASFCPSGPSRPQWPQVCLRLTPRAYLPIGPPSGRAPRRTLGACPWACPGPAPTVSQACPGDLRASAAHLHAPRFEHA